MSRPRTSEPADRMHHAFKHGLYRSSEYGAYQDAKQRCNKPTNGNYFRYGARGIKFLFTSFAQFIEEVGRKPSPVHSIERIKNDGHYEPGNVRWATRVEQRKNQRAIEKKSRCIYGHKKKMRKGRMVCDACARRATREYRERKVYASRSA